MPHLRSRDCLLPPGCRRHRVRRPCPDGVSVPGSAPVARSLLAGAVRVAVGASCDAFVRGFTERAVIDVGSVFRFPENVQERLVRVGKNKKRYLLRPVALKRHNEEV